MQFNRGNSRAGEYLTADNAYYQLSHITKSHNRPRLQIVGDWLPDLGFVNGALVQTLPEADGLLLNLADKNINYSELFNETKKKGGALNRLYLAKEGVRNAVPTLVTTGHHLLRGGVDIGDSLIIKCEYGRITVRKIADNVKLIHVARERHPLTKEPRPIVYLCGEWLSELGFTPDTLYTAAFEQDCITFTAYEKEVVYSDIVKIARAGKMRLLQVSKRDGVPLITLTGAYVQKAGFELGEIFVAEYEYGVVKLTKPNSQRLGFPDE